MGCNIMNIMGILPIPLFPEKLCVGRSPLGLQGQMFLEAGEIPGVRWRPASLPAAGGGLGGGVRERSVSRAFPHPWR